MVTREGFSWLIHLPFERSMGWIHHTYEKDGKVFLQTSIFFEAKPRIEYGYPDLLEEEELRQSLGEFHEKDVRVRYAKIAPAIVAFFDELETAVREINSACSTGIRIVNESGSMLAEVVLPKQEARRDEVLRRNAKAIIEFDLRISRWLKEEYDKLLEPKVD